MKKRKTGFESFAQVFLIVTIVVFVFGIIMVKSVESSYNRTIQKLQNEIDTLESDIDSLQMQKQELVSFVLLKLQLLKDILIKMMQQHEQQELSNNEEIQKCKGNGYYFCSSYFFIGS